MNKYLKYGIIFVIVIIVLYLVNYFLTNDTNEDIKKYLISTGYKEDVDNSLYKSINNSTMDSFNLADYTLMRRIEENEDDVSSLYNGTFSFKNDQLIYNYRIEYGNNINILYRGNYDGDTFNCDKEFSYCYNTNYKY